jgi:hypothetical protein
MARRKRVQLSVEQWQRDAASVWTGMAAWRAAHPKATFSEIEAALDERLNQVRARVLADLAMASPAAELQAASVEERPRCSECGTLLQAGGPSERGVVTQGGAAGRLRRTYATCPQGGSRSFPPG